MQRIFLGIAIFACALGIVGYASAREQDVNTASSAEQDSLRTQKAQVLEQMRKERMDLQEKLRSERATLQKEAKNDIRKLKSSNAQDRKTSLDDMQERREAVLEQAKELRQNLLDGQKQVREEFRKNVQDVKTRARIAAAHGKGLRMINRYRALIARFDHITDKLESRTEKLKDRGIDTSSVDALIATARNTQAEAEATMEELKAKYESLLEGQRESGIAKDAQAIASTLKKVTQDLHAQLRDIASAIRALQPAEEEERGVVPESSTP